MASDFDTPKLYQICLGLYDTIFIASLFKDECACNMVCGSFNGPIVEWCLMGEADWLLPSGTSLAEFALARTNYAKSFNILYISTDVYHEYINRGIYS